jgi:hypothetical protein
MTKITENQRELLARAADDAEGAVGAPQDAKLSRPLIKRGLAISLPVANGGSRLVITDAGRALLGDQTGESESASTAERIPERPSEPDAEAPEVIGSAATRGRPGGKLGSLVDLLSRPAGATLEEMTEATGWQAHSVRGAMSGSLKKKLGLTILSAKADGRRTYRIASEESA